MALKPFNRPIPGMSLTSAPKNAPWERPPEISDPMEALKAHIKRLSDPDRMEATLFLLEDENGITLKQLVTGIVRSAVSNGVHSIDVGLLVAPALHEFIKNTADAVGIEYDEGLEDKEGKEAQKQLRIRNMAKKMLKDVGAKTPEVTMDEDMTVEEATEEVMGQEAPQDMEQQAPAQEAPEMAPRGLMARRG